MTNIIFFQLLDHKHSHQLVLLLAIMLHSKTFFFSVLQCFSSKFLSNYFYSFSFRAVSSPKPASASVSPNHHPINLGRMFFGQKPHHVGSFTSTFQTSPAFHDDLSKCLNIFYPPSTPKFLWCVLPCAFCYVSRKSSHVPLNCRRVFTSAILGVPSHDHSSTTKFLIPRWSSVCKIHTQFFCFCYSRPMPLIFILLDPVTSSTCDISTKSFIIYS